MTTQEAKREVLNRTEIKVYFLEEAELEKLAAQFGTVVVKCGAELKTHYVEVLIPHTEARIVYYN